MERSQRLSTKLLVSLFGFALVAFLALGAGLYAGLTATSVVHAQGDSGNTSFNENRVIAKDETVDGDVNVTNGNLVVYGIVHGNAVVINGNADIEGEVDGDLAVNVAGNVQIGEKALVNGNVLVFGNVVLGPDSHVGGNVSVVGGKVYKDPTATVDGQINAPSLTLNGVTNQIVVTPKPVLPAEAQTLWSATRRFRSHFMTGLSTPIGNLRVVTTSDVICSRCFPAWTSTCCWLPNLMGCGRG